MLRDDAWLSRRKELQQCLQETWLDKFAVGKGNIVVVKLEAETAFASVRSFSHLMN